MSTGQWLWLTALITHYVAIHMTITYIPVPDYSRIQYCKRTPLGGELSGSWGNGLHSVWDVAGSMGYEPDRQSVVPAHGVGWRRVGQKAPGTTWCHCQQPVTMGTGRLYTRLCLCACVLVHACKTLVLLQPLSGSDGFWHPFRRVHTALSCDAWP